MDLKSKRFIWIDLEMTGLNPNKDKIIEIATVVTDHELEIIETGPELVIHQSDEIMDNMDNWCKKYHGKSGLTNKVIKSKITELEAETITLNFLKQHVNENTSPMCGNSICQDRRFLSNYMPKLESFFHYRNLDVSSLKILASTWAPGIYKKIKKNTNHRALDDVLESIAELKLYKNEFLLQAK